MKNIKRMIALVLSIIILLTSNCEFAQAAVVSGKTETNAIELKLGKKKTSKFWTGSDASLYYVVSLPEQGKLSISVSSENLGTDIKVEIRKADVLNWKQETSFGYNKKSKKTSGTLKSDYILPTGNYIIQITPGKVINKTKKVSLTAKFAASKFADIEPNNNEDAAQKIKVYGKTPTYKMYLTSLQLFESQDLIDCMKFTLKDEETVTITMKSPTAPDSLKVFIREKKEDGYNTLESYDVTNGKLSEKIKLPKGTYYIKIWDPNDGAKLQIPYTIKCEA